MSKQTNDFQQIIATVVQLLEGGKVVESVEFPDPDTNEPREVDVYALVQGKVNGEDIRIAVECVDRSRPMGAPWVEMMYGKHSRLQVADIVLLVSSKGFYRPGVLKARKFGYKAIHPVIAPKRLAQTLGLPADPHMSVKVTTMKSKSVSINVSVPGELIDEGKYLRADGSDLVNFDEFKMRAALQDAEAQLASAEAQDSERHMKVVNPVHEGEALHVRLRQADGQTVLARVNFVEFTATLSSTNRADLSVTHEGNFDGVPIGLGTGVIGGQQAHLAVSQQADGNWRGVTRFQHVIPEDS